MNPRHHLDASTIVSYAAGSLPLELAVVTATHLESCGHCRRQVEDAERIGGVLIEQQQPESADEAHRLSLRQSMFERLAEPLPSGAVPASRDEPQPRGFDPDRLPAALQPWFGKTYSDLDWKWMAPGVHCIRAKDTSTLFLLKIAPGRSMPVHGHGRSEITQILRGSYSDALGHFAPGDVADLDSDIQHQPVTSPGVACICVSALDAPLRFEGWLARKLQPIFQL